MCFAFTLCLARYYCKQTTLGLPPRYQQDWQNATFQDANTACQKAGMELPLADDAACVAAFLHRLELSFSSYSFTFPQSAWLHPGTGFGALDPVQSSDMTKRNQQDGLHVICDLSRFAWVTKFIVRCLGGGDVFMCVWGGGGAPHVCVCGGGGGGRVWGWGGGGARV